MGKVFGYLFAVIIAVTFVGLDYVLSARRSGDWSAGGYVSARIGDVPGKVAGLQAWLYPAKPEDMFPDAPKGWTVRRVKEGDLAHVAALPPDQAKSLEDAQGLRDTAARIAMPGYRALRRYYETEGAAMIVEFQFLPSEVANGPGGEGLLMMQEMQAMALGATPYANVRGLALVAADLGNGARLMAGRIGRQISVGILTSADDEGTLAVLRGLDVAGLNRLTSSPVPGIGQGEVALVDAEGNAVAADAGAAPAAPAPSGGFFTSLLNRVTGGGGEAADASGLSPEDIAGKSPEEIAAAVEAEFSAVQSALNEGSQVQNASGDRASVGRISDAPCDTKAGTKFCAVGD